MVAWHGLDSVRLELGRNCDGNSIETNSRSSANEWMIIIYLLIVFAAINYRLHA